MTHINSSAAKRPFGFNEIQIADTLRSVDSPLMRSHDRSYFCLRFDQGLKPLEISVCCRGIANALPEWRLQRPLSAFNLLMYRDGVGSQHLRTKAQSFFVLAHLIIKVGGFIVAIPKQPIYKGISINDTRWSFGDKFKRSASFATYYRSYMRLRDSGVLMDV